MLNNFLSIIIVNYQSAKWLRACVSSIYEKIGSAIPLEIIIVNNDKSEALDDILEEKTGVKIINNFKNVGFGKGNNIGAKEAKGNSFLFLNPDTQIISSSIKEVLMLLEREDVGVVGSKLCLENGEIQEWSAGFKVNFFSLIKNNLGKSKSQKIWEKSDITQVDWVSGAALFTKREFFEKIGGFDENFFMYFEDVDLCKRIRENGKNILYYPNFLVKHIGGESYGRGGDQKRDYYVSQEYYFKKNCNFFEWILIKILGKFFY